MDNYLVSWRLTNAAGEILRHPKHDYPLGVDMWWRQYRLHFLSNNNLKSLPEMTLVSSTILKMVSRPTPDRGMILRFKGKSSPMTEQTPWSYLEWYPSGRPGPVAHHILMRFGSQIEGPVHPVRRPGRNCPAAIKYLLHRSDLMRDSDDDPAVHDHEICLFDAPVGIFWGLLGLRTLNKWWVVPELLEHGSWFRTGPPGFDPAPYRPGSGTLPRGVYLKVWIGVHHRHILPHCYFRISTYNEIIIDDPYISDDEDSLEEESDNGDYPDLGPGRGGEPLGSIQGGELVRYSAQPQGEPGIPKSRVSNDLRLSERHTGHHFYDSDAFGSPNQDDVILSSPSYEGRIPAPPRRRSTHDRSKRALTSPSIPDDLKFEELYIDRERLGRERLYIKQDLWQQKDLIRRGTGMILDDVLSSSVEDASPLEMPKYRKHSLHERYHENEDDDEMRDSEDFHQYPEDEYFSGGRLMYSGSDLPIVPNEGGFEGIELTHPRNIPHDAAGEFRGYQGRRSRQHPQYPRYQEEGEIMQESFGSPHSHHGSPRYQSEFATGFYEGHEADNIGTYNFRGSPGVLDQTRRVNRMEGEEATMASDEEHTRPRRKKAHRHPGADQHF